MTTLDAYCRTRSKRPTVVKIDVETFEAQVLRGALQTLADARPSVVCELLPSAAPEPTREVLEQIRRLDYRVNRWVEGSGWQECAIDDVLAHANGTHRDWLFSPRPLTAQFRSTLEEWLAAIAECTIEQNLLIPGGTKPPAGWDEAYSAVAGAKN